MDDLKDPIVETKPEPVKDAKPVFKAEKQEDHLAIIKELVLSLGNVSPSGAETVRDKILERLDAIRDPKVYDARKQAEFKAEQDLEAQRAKDRAKLRIPVTEPKAV